MQTLAEYPADSWRPNQRDYANKVLELASGPETRCVLEGPCGSGKSVGYLRPLLDPSAPKSMVLTTTRQHLRQLEETLRRYWPDGEGEKWAILRGRSYYDCCGHKHSKDSKNNPITAEDYDPAKEHVDQDDEPKQGSCPLGEDKCKYREAVRAAARAQVNFQATIGGLYRKRYWGELEAGAGDGSEAARKKSAWALARRGVVDRSVVVLDEAHEYLRVRRDFETAKAELWLKGILDPKVVAWLQSQRQKPGGYVSSSVLLEPESVGRLMLAANFRRLLQDENVEKMLPAGKHLDNREEIKRRWVKKLTTRLSMLETGDVVSVQWEGWGMQEKCSLVSEPLYAGVREKLAPVEIFTSATIAEIAPMMGVAKENVVVYPEIFDWDAAVTVNPLPDNANGSKRSVAVDANMIEEIYHAEGRPLTIALFLSKKQAHEAAKKISRERNVFIQGWDRDTDLGELIEQVRRAAFNVDEFDAAWEGQPGPVGKPADPDEPAPFLITYGGWVGTDLPGHKWLVIGSAPKTPISPVHEARQARRRIRSAWDDGEKVTLDRLQLQQGLGRALRSAEDRATVIWPANAAFADLGLDETTGRLV